MNQFSKNFIALFFHFTLSFFILIFAFYILLLPKGVYAQDITTGLVGHWKFDETSGTSASDSSGNNNTGTLINSPTWTTGKIGNAVSIGGSSYVSVNSTLDVAALPFSLSLWVNPTNFNDYGTLIGKRTTYSTSGMRFNLDLNQGNGSILFQSASSNLNFTYVPSLNQWTLLTVVARSGTTDLYVNGAFNQTLGGFILGTGSTAQVRMGNAADGPDQYVGSLDDARIYTRALTSADISALYVYTGGLPDTQAPTTPTNLSATTQSSSQINLSWTASSDNVGVTGYRVERCLGSSCTNFVQIATPSTTSYNDTGLSANTTYRYQVRAADAAGNLSGYSGVTSATTQAGTSSGYTRVFYDGFEDGTTGKWTFPGTFPQGIVSSTAHDGGSPRAGTKMAELNWNSANYSYLYLNSWQYANEFLIRFWCRYDADVDRLVGNKLIRMDGSTSPSDSFYLSSQVEVNAAGPIFAYFEQINGSPGPISYGDGAGFGNGQWHKIEIYVKRNTAGQANGALRVWRDGNSIINASNVITHAPGSNWGEFTFVSNWSQTAHDDNNHAYFDDIEIFSDSASGTV